MKIHFFKINNKKRLNNKFKYENLQDNLSSRQKLKNNSIKMILEKKYFILSFILFIVIFLCYKEYVHNQNTKVTIIKELPKRNIEENNQVKTEEPIVATFDNIREFNNMEDLQKYVYTIDATAFVEKDDLPIEEFLKFDFKTNIYAQEPKILIFHTHSQEDFSDSRDGYIEDTIVGVGRELAQILTSKYGINVVHDVGKYDFIDGKVARGGSYEKMEPAELEILKKYPTIEVAIDLHRDAIENKKLVTTINGQETAKIMFFNGVTKLNNKGMPKHLPDLVNPYLKENLAFSLQMFLMINDDYPTLCRRNYIKPYRYSLHMLPKSLLVEVGANTNTVQEAKNAMIPLAEALVKVLK